MSVNVLSALGSRTFASLLRHPNYRLYFAGNGISFIGSWMQQIAAYWLILEITRSPVAVGTRTCAKPPGIGAGLSEWCGRRSI